MGIQQVLEIHFSNMKVIVIFVSKYGKFVWALYDDEEKNLRLFCIKFSSVAIILGGGGSKDKFVIKWQDDENSHKRLEALCFMQNV